MTSLRKFNNYIISNLSLDDIKNLPRKCMLKLKTHIPIINKEVISNTHGEILEHKSNTIIIKITNRDTLDTFHKIIVPKKIKVIPYFPFKNCIPECSLIIDGYCKNVSLNEISISWKVDKRYVIEEYKNFCNNSLRRIDNLPFLSQNSELKHQIVDGYNQYLNNKLLDLDS